MGNAKIIAALTKAQKEMSAKKGRTGTHKNRSNQYIKGTAQRERVNKAIGFKPKLEIYEAMVADMERRGMTSTQWLDMVIASFLEEIENEAIAPSTDSSKRLPCEHVTDS